jgi:hypothetical protein
MGGEMKIEKCSDCPHKNTIGFPCQTECIMKEKSLDKEFEKENRELKKKLKFYEISLKHATEAIKQNTIILKSLQDK